MQCAPTSTTTGGFFSRRLGLFIHWGIYAIPGWQEQHQLRLKTPRAKYAKLAARFNPTAFDPDAWIDLAEAAGVSYLVFTTKHLDGFCLWNTATTDFNVTRTPYGRDALAGRASKTKALFHSISTGRPVDATVCSKASWPLM